MQVKKFNDNLTVSSSRFLLEPVFFLDGSAHENKNVSFILPNSASIFGSFDSSKAAIITVNL